ncbi:MAG: Acetyltransferase [Verrucomicrobiales bacterium]|nr:Acetyltransferase [Verrucomicrobiales bacterium]
MSTASDFSSPSVPASGLPAAPAFTLGRLRLDQHEEAAAVIHRSLVEYYGRNLNQSGRFGDDWRPFMIMPELYEALDPGCAITACGVDDRLLGVCFYHPRETHVSLGIVATDPLSGGRGVARAMVAEALRLADGGGLPARLVSSALNLDSFSLYTRLGFVPGQVFQDMQFPPDRLPPLSDSSSVRPATSADVTAMADLEFSLTGIRREKDYAFFLRDPENGWNTLVSESPEGALRGFLCGVRSGGTRMIGPGVTAGGEAAWNLITAQLHLHPDTRPVFLVPVKCADLVARLYAAGARNVELHLAQTRALPNSSSGAAAFPLSPDAVVIPTFLPESG